MRELKLNLENCYGIRRLSDTVNLEGNGAAAIYAPNGVMKTSLAQTFRDLQTGATPRDRRFPDKTTIAEILDEAGTPLPANSIFVVSTHDRVLKTDERTAALLVSTELRNEHAALRKDVSKAKADLLKKLKSISKSSENIEHEIALAFSAGESFAVSLNRMRNEITNGEPPEFPEFDYDLIFSEKALVFLGSPDVNSAIAEYITTYDSLLDRSKYFKRGFNFYNASTIAKALNDNGFFAAKHTVKFNGASAREICDERELAELIEGERTAILEDAGLRAKFDALDKQINRRTDLRDLHNYLLEHKELLPHLSNLDLLRQKVWRSFLRLCPDLVVEYLDLDAKVSKRLREIEEAAREERGDWEQVIRVFNERFDVPFDLTTPNKAQVALGQDKILTLGFSYRDDDGGSVEVEHNKLLESLSTGESKAFFILNMIFELAVRTKQRVPTLFVLDDIADSFDYRNKYAIVEYLRDIVDQEHLKLLILTHNFDFFRTVHSRYVDRDRCYTASKTGDGVRLDRPDGLRDIFTYWKTQFSRNPRIKVACIPFMRNLVEYTNGKADVRYLALTAMLHVQPNGTSPSVSQLHEIYQGLFGANPLLGDDATLTHEFVLAVADEVLRELESFGIEGKLALAVATRLRAERYMLKVIGDDSCLTNITKNQTSEIFDRYTKIADRDPEADAVLRRVMLMTPESIHLNSFMFEPLVDISDTALRRVYEKLLAL